MKNFPVFVFPVSLEFYLNARHTHKQLLTVYNPYEFSVNFKVLCTSPNKFTVIDPEGVIAPQSCIDIVVRYSQPSISHCNSAEKFRITMYDRNTQQALGKRDIPTKLIEGEPCNINQESLGDNFHPLTTKPAPMRTEEHSRVICNHSHHRDQPINVVAVAVSICCIAALLLPTQPEQVLKSQWPEWLHIGSNLKLVFSFVLGLVSMLVLRP
ncbi:motile sperm domain-containing protein 1 isoform 1 [Danaus plexippus plexippus]|uniref:Motile sperm domain-containing protein 1 isoform 1 n=1 Tax=Danaus plexippus plexippus TaxID=278856 RepID=A0A212FGA4_DANPL|nr:motile sperm domain-containing protein 1 isoform 1 [Danaus plexippus plexippus]